MEGNVDFPWAQKQGPLRSTALSQVASHSRSMGQKWMWGGESSGWTTVPVGQAGKE
jgi:hypothetical protein